jgi:purine-binding chemotaxis protein CheW
MVAALLLDDSFPVEKKDGKHLIFQLEERGYGIPILTVNEIIGIMDITPIPRAPGFIKGVINLRGKIIPVMDLRLKFGMVEKEYDEQTCIIIVNVNLDNAVKQIGVVVDIVSEVVDIPASEIEAAPKYSTHDDEDFLNGIGKVKDKVVMLLDIEKVIYSEEIIEMLEEKEVNKNNNK